MHHGTCVTHVPWCMSGSLTCGGGENVPGIPGACAPAILRIWQGAHEIGSAPAFSLPSCHFIFTQVTNTRKLDTLISSLVANYENDKTIPSMKHKSWGHMSEWLTRNLQDSVYKSRFDQITASPKHFICLVYQSQYIYIYIVWVNPLKERLNQEYFDISHIEFNIFYI